MKGLKLFYAQDRITFSYSLLFPLLFALSGAYALLAGILRFFYKAGILRAYRPKARVISVGNITLGGSGKTPLAQYLASRLSDEKHNVVVLLRGYKKPEKSNLSGDFDCLGDEGSMLKENLAGKVAIRVGKDRAQIARHADEERVCDTIILDDGFQHWRLKRDLDIVVLDAMNPFGNRLLLPAGPLREPLRSLKRADLFCLTHADVAGEARIGKLESLLFGINPRAGLMRAVHAPEYLIRWPTQEHVPLETLKSRDVCLFCGIAKPLFFQRSVERLGARVVVRRFFQDHHIFRQKEIEDLGRQCRASAIGTAVTTQKDAQRLRERISTENCGIDILVLKVVLKVVKGKEALDERLHSLYNS